MRSKSRSLALLLICILPPHVSSCANVTIDDSNILFTNHIVPQIRIQLPEESLTSLRQKFREYVKCTVFEGTNIYQDVGIHLKGQYGTFQGIDARPSLTLNFDKYVHGQRFFGMDKCHLNNSVQDPSYLCEVIGRELMAGAGIPTGRASHALVKLNGRELGLFVLIEGYDKRFLQRHFKNTAGNLYDSEFRHDITEPLKRTSGDGPANHADLQELAIDAREPDQAERLAKLSKLLDLERFYSMLALESLMPHHDGYARAINNYWLYFDPTSGKAVFIPHGMDQIFYEPLAPLLPDVQGVLARAVLQTQPGRKEFRAHCGQFYATLFPGLSNRVQLLRNQIRPKLAQMDLAIATQHDATITNLLRRIQQRIQYLTSAGFNPPRSPAFDKTGMAILTNCLPCVEGGTAVVTETNLAGEIVLQAHLVPNENPMIVRWQNAVLLSKGIYRFSAKITADQPVFRGPLMPVSVKVWGMDELRVETIRTEARVLEIQCLFEAGPERDGEYVIECETRGNDLSVSYQITSIRFFRERL